MVIPGQHQGLAPRAVLLLLLVLGTAVCSEASEGDESPVFQQCMQTCFNTGCTKTPGSSNTCDTMCENSSGYHPPWTLRLMQWDCASDCAYHCMWAIETPKEEASDGPVYKYYGKWPFTRILGAQEIASVLFSIANLLAHAHNLQLYLRLVKSHKQGPSSGGAGPHKRSTTGSGSSSATGSQYPYHRLWLLYAAVNINAWLWSSVFHCRDTRLTERLDYFSADLVVAVGCGVVIARTLQLTSARHLLMLSLVLGAALLQHIHYMAFVKFHYGYNMMLCIAVGIATAVAWLVWVTSTKHPGRWTLYKFMGLVHLAMLLEVLDFPPFLHTFDAHALWHAATVPLTYLWYQFMAADVLAWHQQQPQSADGDSRLVPAKGSSSALLWDKQKR